MPSPTVGAQVHTHPANAKTWIVTLQALKFLQSDSGSAATLSDADRIFEIVRPNQKAISGLRITIVESFASLTQMQDAIDTRQLVPGAKAVLYDPEHWAFTPTAEQADPATYIAEAATLAHKHGLLLIAAPAMDLVNSLKPQFSSSGWQEYLHLGLAGAAGRSADVVVLQSQSLERDPATFQQFLTAGSAQVRAVNPEAWVVAGLSSNPPGAPVAAALLRQDIQLTQDIVQGYWMNIPGNGPQCPTCNPIRPQIAIAALQPR